MKKLIIYTIISLISLHSFAKKKSTIDAFNYAPRKQKECTKAAVVCAHPLASQVGQMILKKGGNAVDAAIAMQWALAVVYPGAGNIGGGGFMVMHLKNGQSIALDYREVAPSAASRDMYVDSKTGKANTKLSQNGPLAAGVPGTPAGLFAALRYAKLPMKTLIQPAIDLASQGFALSEREATRLNDNLAFFDRQNTMPCVFMHNGKPWKAGEKLVQKELAATLKRIQKSGADGFYNGPTAQLIAKEMERSAGIITQTDLLKYKAVERTPLAFDYKGYTIITMPPPSSGGIMLLQMLKMLEPRPLPSYGFLAKESVQLVTEVERRAYADRAEHMGDPDFYNVPHKTITSSAYLQQRMADYDSTKASRSDVVKAGLIKESEQTTHISILDGEGNAVSTTTTLNGAYGCKTVVGGAGFFLNNEMDDFSVQAGVPNMYGAVGGVANAIAPGKRMLSSMTPAVVLKDGKPFMVVGTPGGTTIATSVLQSIIDVIDFGMSAPDAVNQPKFHHQWLPDELYVEKEFPQEVRLQLQNMGYKVTEREPIGRTEMILVQPNGKLIAVGDNRGDDSVAGE